jgi:hypothetical protein
VVIYILAAFTNFFLELQRLKKRAKDNVIKDLKPTSDGDLLLNK